MRSFLSHPSIFNPPPGHSVVEDRHGELHLVEDRELLEAAREVARDLRIEREVGLSVGEIAEIVGRVAREETMFRFDPAYTFPRSRSAVGWMRRKSTPGMRVKIYSATVVKAAEGEIQALVSTRARDRDNEAILPEAFRDRLRSFREYPVFVSSHDYRSGLLKVIGKAESVSITDDGLKMRLRYFVGQGNEEADWGFKLAQNGLAAFSVGFLPYAWRDGDGTREPLRTYTDVELLEVSQVVVPSNRDALVSAR